MQAVIDKKSGISTPDIDLQISAYVELLRNGTPEGLSFDEEHHIFTVKGEVIPSVTTILKKAKLTPDWSKIDPWYAQRGKYIHTATELWEKGTLDEDTVDKEILPYLNGYKSFRADYPVKVIGQEVKLWHPVYKFAGIIDMIIEGNSHYKLFLRKTGKYKLVEVTNIRSHFNVFLSALVEVTGNRTEAQKEIARINLEQWRKKNMKEATNAG